MYICYIIITESYTPYVSRSYGCGAMGWVNNVDILVGKDLAKTFDVLKYCTSFEPKSDSRTIVTRGW